MAAQDTAQHRRSSRHHRRSWSEQDDNGLTELAAPDPVSHEEPSDDLSREQSRATEKEREESEGDEAGLTELAAPRPVDEREKADALEDEEQEAQYEEGDSDPEATPAHDAASPHTSQDSGTAEGSHKGTESKESVSKSTAIWTEAVTISWLIFFSFIGTLARMGVEALTTYPLTPFSSTVLWANLGGSLFLGFLIEDRNLFRKTVPVHLIMDDKEKTHGHIARHQKTLPIYIGLATGFCGSFTSFSTFITDAFLVLANEQASSSPTTPYHDISAASIHARNGGYSFMALVGVLIVHPAVSISALKTGAHIALGTERFMPSIPSKLITHWLDRMVLVLGLGCWIGAVLLSVFPPGVASEWRSRATMPLIFSPPGVLLRFYLSKHLNPRLPSFPLGTFAANIIGTVVEAVCYVLQHSNGIVLKSGSVNLNACVVLEGWMQGFCGCLTTVSTWVAELNGLRRRHAWFYALMSLAVALGSQVVIIGTVLWTRGLNDSCGAFE